MMTSTWSMRSGRAYYLVTSTMAVLLLAVAVAGAQTPDIPEISGPITGPDLMYPNPPINVVTDAAQVEDFPYITEEYFVSGIANDLPYTTRIIVRRPQRVGRFSGTVVAEALHSGGQSLTFERWPGSTRTGGHT